MGLQKERMGTAETLLAYSPAIIAFFLLLTVWYVSC